MTNNVPDRRDNRTVNGLSAETYAWILEEDEASKARWSLLLEAAGVPHDLRGFGRLDARGLLADMLDMAVDSEGPMSEPRQAWLTSPSPIDARTWLRAAVRLTSDAEMRAKGTEILDELPPLDPPAPDRGVAHVVLPREARRLLRWLLRLKCKESHEDMGTALGMHKATVAAHLETLQGVGYVRRQGEGRRAAYVVTEAGADAAPRRADRT